MNINKIITAKGRANYIPSDYYEYVKQLIRSGYSNERARFAALPPKTFWVK